MAVQMESWGKNEKMGLNSLSRQVTAKENQAGPEAGGENKPQK